MAPNLRQQAIIEAVTPLLLERGSEATSRELAQAAGIAEGTLFRAFESKDELIHAVLVAYVDVERLTRRMQDVSASAQLEETLEHIIAVLTEHIRGIFAISSALKASPRHAGRPPYHHERSTIIQQITSAIESTLRPFAAELEVGTYQAARFVRGVCFSATFAHDEEAEPALTPSELAGLVVHGITRRAPNSSTA